MSASQVNGNSVGEFTGGTVTTNCGGTSGYYPPAWYNYHVYPDPLHRDFANWLRGFMEGKKSFTQAEMQALRDRMQLLN